ncbi:unnamed protein product [Rotaria magnacalcarata]|uniref:Uncharacterized protein n=1 Tax=Rotaria magnacalcarata TaxID=392030 RepID=A0A816X527_9BILA|nr:unnamed protein product [Rotaria magnacalcarata]
MTTFKRHIDTSLLPDDIFSYTDAQFYDVVKRIVGEGAAELFEIQSIRSPDAFLLIPDVFAILNIKCAALNSLKEKICLKSDDDLYIVKPGQQQHITPSTSTKPNQSSSTVLVDEKYHRSFILKSITNWCQRYSSKLSLSEGVDYHLFLASTSDTNFTARIKCRCGSKINLVKLQKNFQLSNFYKHLVSATCNTTRASKKKSSKENFPNQINSNSNDDAPREVEGGVKRSSTSNAPQKKRFHPSHSK